MKRTAAVLLALAVAVGLTACARSAQAGDGGAVDDAVMLDADDVPGTRITSGGPDSDPHPLPPGPCGALPAPSAERAINIEYEDNSHHVYEYVARYASGEARRAVEDLVAQIGRCPHPTAGERYKVLQRDTTGALFVHDFPDGDAMAAYYVGFTDEYMVAVVDVGATGGVGDVTTTSGLGAKAMSKAGGTRGKPVSEPPATADWVGYEAEVTGVRRGPDQRTLLVEVLIPKGADCAKKPQTTYVTEENNQIYANVVVDSLASERCAAKVAGLAPLTVKAPVGDRVVVLNQKAWAPAGSGYRRCDGAFGCNPPPANHCDQAWIDVTVSGLDIPQHSAHDVEYCKGSWLILTIDTNAGMCGPDGGREGCSVPSAAARRFMRFDNGWATVTSTKAGGCAAVLAAEPTFPRAACENLRPVG